MRCHLLIALLCFATLIGIVRPARTDESAAKKTDAPTAPKADQPAEKDKGKEPASKESKPAPVPTPTPPATHTVKKELLKVVVNLDGVFAAEKTREIVVAPKEWTALSVENAVPHGTRVRKGDVLLTFDTEKLDRAIADLRTELKLSELTLQQNEGQLQSLDKTTPLELDAGRRAARDAEEDRKYFFEVDRPFTLRAIDFSLKVTAQALEYEEEELRQLEKMYEADEITEETEEIVLKRARDSVERAKFMLEYARLTRDHILQFTLPRAEESVNELTRRKSLDWEKNKVVLPLALERQRLELDKLRVQRERSEERLKTLLADRELMTVKSPIDGIVYYGKCTRGRFSDSTGLAETLRRNGAVGPNQVVMTVVRPRPMYIWVSVPEAELHNFRPDVKGRATPTGYPEMKLPVSVDEISDVPAGPGTFDGRLDVRLDRNKNKRLMPGMTCKVKLVVYEKDDALTVPPKVVHADERDDQKNYVWLLDKDGKPQRRDVKLGKRTDKQVEILKCLAEGDKVLLEPPKDEG